MTDFSKFSVSKFRQYIQALGIKSSEEWRSACNHSFNEAIKNNKRYREIVEGLFLSPYVGGVVQIYEKYPSKSVFDRCVRDVITSSEELLEHNEEWWDALGLQDTPYFWQGVRIALGVEDLPDDFDPLTSPIPLGIEHLAALGIHPPKY